MAGMTSQPSMGAIVACAKGTKLDTGKSHGLFILSLENKSVCIIYTFLEQHFYQFNLVKSFKKRTVQILWLQHVLDNETQHLFHHQCCPKVIFSVFLRVSCFAQEEKINPQINKCITNYCPKSQSLMHSV